jgi:hypothetical protein
MAKKVEVEIDVSVKGDQSINKLNQQVESSDEKFVSLRRQIRETTVQLQEMADNGEQGSKAFKKLADHLDELQDQQKRVAFQSAQIEDKLAALPGPIGNIGQAFAKGKEAVDTFGAGLAVALGVIALVVGAFEAMKKSLEATKEGQKKLQEVTIALEKIMNAFLAVVEPIATQLITLVTNLLKSKEVMDGLKITAQVLAGTITFLLESVVNLAKGIGTQLVTAFKTLINVGAAAGKVVKGIFTLDWDTIKAGFNEGTEALKNGFNATVDNIKTTGKGFANAYTDAFKAADDAGKDFEKGLKRTTKTQEEENKKQLEETLKKLDAKQKLDEAALAKSKAIIDEQNFNDEQRLYTQIEFDKKAYDLTVSGIEAKQKLYKKDTVEWKGLQADKTKAEADFIAKSKDNGDKLLAIQEANSKKSIDFEVQLAKDLEKVEDDKKATRIKALDDELQLLQIRQKGQVQNSRLYFQTLRDIEDTAHKKALESLKKGSKEYEVEMARHAQANVDIDKQEKAARLALNISYADQVENIGNSLTKLAGKNKDLAVAGIRIAEAATISKIWMADSAAIRDAYEANPIYFGLPWSAFYAADMITGIAGAHMSANEAIQSLNSVPGVEGSSTSGGGIAPTYSAAPTTAAPIVNTTNTSNNPATQIGQTLNNAQKQPVRAYVVSSDISTQQQLDRKTNRAATFGLG